VTSDAIEFRYWFRSFVVRIEDIASVELKSAPRSGDPKYRGMSAFGVGLMVSTFVLVHTPNSRKKWISILTNTPDKLLAAIKSVLPPEQ